MTNPPIEIRSDFIRIARAFTYGASGVFTQSKFPDWMPPIRGIYVEPHPSGTGVQIVSTDGCALCVQWDRKGRVDKSRLIADLTHQQCLEFSGADLNARWLVGTGEELALRTDGKKKTKLPGVTALGIFIANDPKAPPGAPRYPDWRHLVPTNPDKLTPGFPGLLNAAYLSIIARLYDDGMQNMRNVRVLCHVNDPKLPVVLQFPWRPDMMVVIAPMKDDPSMWADTLTRITSAEPVDPDDPFLKDDGADDDDPAAGL